MSVQDSHTIIVCISRHPDQYNAETWGRKVGKAKDVGVGASRSGADVEMFHVPAFIPSRFLSDLVIFALGPTVESCFRMHVAYAVFALRISYAACSSAGYALCMRASTNRWIQCPTATIPAGMPRSDWKVGLRESELIWKPIGAISESTQTACPFVYLKGNFGS